MVKYLRCMFAEKRRERIGGFLLILVKRGQLLRFTVNAKLPLPINKSGNKVDLRIIAGLEAET